MADATIVGKIFKVEGGWNLRVTVNGGQAGKFEKGPFPTAKECCEKLSELTNKLESLYDSEDFASL